MASFTLSDLSSPRTFRFQFFPDQLRIQRRVNWRPQETTIGTKPLMYENREPKLLTIPNLWLDNTDTNTSLTDSLETLESWSMDEVADEGSPPSLLAAWGDQRLRCVMQDMTVEEQFFTPDGEPLRARLTLELIEIQERDGATNLVVGGT